MVKKPGRPLQECPHPRRDCSCKTRRARALMLKIHRGGLGCLPLLWKILIVTGSECLCAPRTMEMVPPVESVPAYPVQNQHPVSSHMPFPNAHMQSPGQPQEPAGAPPLNLHDHSPISNPPIQQCHTSIPPYPDLIHARPIPTQNPILGNHQPLLAGQSGYPQKPSFPQLASSQDPEGTLPQPWPPITAPEEGSCCSRTPIPEEQKAIGTGSGATIAPVHHISPETWYDNLPAQDNKTEVETISPLSPLVGKQSQPSKSFLSEIPTTTVYHIPSTVATADHPISPAAIADLQKNEMYRRQVVPITAMSGIAGVAAPSADAHSAGECSTTSHICHCGDGCRCTACPVHPNNPTMQAKVQEMAEHLAYAGPGSTGTSRPHSSYGNVLQQSEQPPLSPLSPAFSSDSAFEWPPITSGDQYRSGPAPVPLDSPIDNDHTRHFSSGDYLHFQFDLPPFPDCLAPPEVNCHCTYGCVCAGCLEHTGHIEGQSVEQTRSEAR